MAVRMEVKRILIKETDDYHIVELREQDGERLFPIEIGINEAAAIQRRLKGDVPPRPQTHELLANVLEHFGARIERILINDLRDHTFYARLFLRQGETITEIDSRPSDALALGVASDVPIFVEEHVLEQVCNPQS